MLSLFSLLSILFVGISILILYFSQRPYSFWIGKKFTTLSLRPLAFITIQLLAIGIGLDIVSTWAGVNDTQGVTNAILSMRENVVLGIILLAIGAIGEELFFRGILFPIIGMIPSSLLFSFFHTGYGSIIQLIGSFIVGIILCRARVLNESILPGILGHFTYNAIILFILV
ncbi:MAG: CPBP family intramembrane glutamic endopeptidase [Candidatus Diapherotrites archaeon]